MRCDKLLISIIGFNKTSNPMKWVSSSEVETPMNQEDAHLRISLTKRIRPTPSETLVSHLMCRNLKPRKRYKFFSLREIM